MSRVDGVFKEFPRASDLGELFPPDKVVIHSIYLVRARLTRGARHCNVEVDITSAKTGKQLWVHDTQAHIWGSPMIADGKVFIGNEDGDLYVFEAKAEKKLLNQVNMGAPILATPVVANGTLFINTQTHLFAISEGAKPEEKQK